MTEIIQLHFGSSGVNVGAQYLEKLVMDHNLTSNLFFDESNQIFSEKITVSFEQQLNTQFTYRGIFFDLEQNSIDKILTSKQSQFLQPDQIFSQNSKNASGTFHGSSNLFRNESKNQFEEMARKVVERCDKYAYFNETHSMYDKSCGFSIEAMQTIGENYSYHFLGSNSIFPNMHCSNPIEIYNFAFGIFKLIDKTFITLAYDYEALERATIKLKQQSTLENYHDIIAETMLQATCSQRFSGYQNCDLSKISTNLVPFPRIHFLTCKFSPLYQSRDLFEQIQELSHPSDSYYTYQSDVTNDYKTQALIIRSEKDYLETHIYSNKFQNTEKWIEDGFCHVNCKVEHRALGQTAMHIGNQGYFGHSLKKISEFLTASFRKKAFVHYYFSEGADEMEFYEAESHLNDLVSEYQDYGGCGSDYCEEEEEG